MVQEAGEAPTGEEKKDKGPSFEALLAAANPGDGAKVFRKCQACHTAAKDGKNMTGPWLYDVVGRKVASEAGFDYTDAMKEHGGVWSYERLNTYLTDPRGVVPGTKMSFAGLPKVKDRANVIAYLRAHTENPPPLPPVPDQTAAGDDGAVGATRPPAAASGESGVRPQLPVAKLRPRLLCTATGWRGKEGRVRPSPFTRLLTIFERPVLMDWPFSFGDKVGG